jgi:hypothetical protein
LVCIFTPLFLLVVISLGRRIRGEQSAEPTDPLTA